ncbi:hypothetical protein HDU67_005118 [Dinochytrium kinnereticum]|nr:hypothetical protein HDU67_005118 [Dinochytrium kinnereticum]
MAGAQNWQGLFVVRIFFGAAQAGFVPGILLYLSSFYTRDERTVRLSFVVGVATCASTFGAVFAKSLERLFLPSFPQTCNFLSPADRLVAASRVSDEDDAEPETPGTRAKTTITRMASHVLGGPRPPPYKLHIPQLLEVFRDIQFYLLAALYLCLTISTDALAQLAPEIAAGTFTRGQGATRYSLAAALLSVAPYGVAAGCSILWAYRSDRTGDRGLHIALPLLMAGVGFAVIAIIPESRWREVPIDRVESAVEQILKPSHVVTSNGVAAVSVNLTSTAVVVRQTTQTLVGASTLFFGGSTTPITAATESDGTMWIQPVGTVTEVDPPGPTPSLDPAEMNIVAEQADLIEGGDGGVASGALRYFFGLVPASVGLLSALPSLLALVIDRAHGATGREAAAALVTAMGSVGGGVAVPLLFPPSQAPDEEAEGVATWGRGYALGCGLCAVGCGLGAGIAMIVRWIKWKEDQGVWGHGRGLRRLLNDAEEKGAWDDGDANESFGGDGISDMMIAGGGGGWRGKAVAESTDNVAPDSEWDLRIGTNSKGYKNLF